MNIRSFVLLSAAAMLPGLACAAAPGAQWLGGAQAVGDFCARVDRAHAQQFEHHILEVLGIGKAPEEVFETARRDPEYQSGYKLFESVLNQYSVADAKRACESIFARRVPNAPHEKNDEGRGRNKK